MLVLTFTCRALLIFLLSESVHTDRSPPFLITENTWPRGCALDCHRGRHGAVCGSDGRLFKSLCSFQRAQCINTQLRIAPRAHCTDPGQSRCQLARSQALESSARIATSTSSGGSSHGNAAAAIFVPECNADGSYVQVQCHDQTGYCWCSSPNGKPISGTSVLHLAPNCTGNTAEMSPLTDLESAQHTGEEEDPSPTVDPVSSRPSPDLTAPPFWVTILLNSDPNGNRSGKRPTDSPHTCERERASLLSQTRLARPEERFLPECSADGRYSPVQCHVATGYCWCVRIDTGRPLPGTSARNHLPECSSNGEPQTDRGYRDRPLPGCPGARKKEFIQNLVRALQLEAEQAGKLSPHSESSGPEGALRWHFTQLDADSSGVLSEREARPLRQYLRRNLKPRRCAKKFAQYCDHDGDKGLSLEELTTCLGL
ncbi:SPARC-related modular calcium-binding protein 1-like [Aplochiton taeniatus]